MRTILVDDEVLMLKHFARLSRDIPDLDIVGQFDTPQAALAYVAHNAVDVAFLDVVMPQINGIELAKKLREIRPQILLVIISAYDDYLWDFNQMGGDYYIVKPYTREVLEMAMERIRLLSRRQKKRLFIRTFGRFVVFDGDKAVPLTGKAKEILALLVAKRGKEISNEEIYDTLWEGRSYSNDNMSVFYNALRRLRLALKKAALEDLLISTPHGQMINLSLFNCDYYDYLDDQSEPHSGFDGEFLSEYSWGEVFLADLVNGE